MREGDKAKCLHVDVGRAMAYEVLNLNLEFRSHGSKNVPFPFGMFRSPEKDPHMYIQSSLYS